VSADPDLAHIVRVTLEAKRMGSLGPHSTGEKLASALVLNRADWLTSMDYTIAEAIDRIGMEWASRLRQAERVVSDMPE
jgi:hypothetical protein